MNDNIIRWNVSHYGTIIDDYETVYEGGYIRQKIYEYENKYYIDTWCNGNRLLFTQLTKSII